MYTSFAIKYRPVSLQDMVGHGKIKKDLFKRAEENSWPKAMIFSGVSGLGKTTFQRIVAKYILCMDKVKGQPCNICDACKTIDNEEIANYYFEENASNLNIEKMREMETLAGQFVLGASKNKVFVIDEMQELNKNKQAQKNILKVIEGKDKLSYFILGTMDISKVDRAILGRCIKYHLFPLSVADTAKYLLEICKKENVSIDSQEKMDVLFSIADSSGGIIRDALSYLERAIYSEIWNKNELQKELNIVSINDIKVILHKIIIGDKNIFNFDFNEDVLKKIIYLLNMIYKAKNGVELNAWQNSLIADILGPIDKAIIKYIIDELNKLFMYAYLTPELIEFTIINIMNHIADSIKERRRI